MRKAHIDAATQQRASRVLALPQFENFITLKINTMTILNGHEDELILRISCRGAREARRLYASRTPALRRGTSEGTGDVLDVAVEERRQTKQEK